MHVGTHLDSTSLIKAHYTGELAILAILVDQMSMLYNSGNGFCSFNIEKIEESCKVQGNCTKELTFHRLNAKYLSKRNSFHSFYIFLLQMQLLFFGKKIYKGENATVIKRGAKNRNIQFLIPLVKKPFVP